jgi:hypothetical protein
VIKKLVWEDAKRVAANMREVDRAEICGMSVSDNPVHAISSLEVLPHFGATVWKDGEPIVVVGAMLLWPGIASVFMYATPRWKEVMVETTRFVRAILLPTLVDANVHRLQCYSSADHFDAHAWLRYLGADREVPMPAFGKHRQDYVLFEMSRAALERVTSVGN